MFQCLELIQKCRIVLGQTAQRFALTFIEGNEAKTLRTLVFVGKTPDLKQMQ